MPVLLGGNQDGPVPALAKPATGVLPAAAERAVFAKAVAAAPSVGSINRAEPLTPVSARSGDGESALSSPTAGQTPTLSPRIGGGPTGVRRTPVISPRSVTSSAVIRHTPPPISPRSVSAPAIPPGAIVPPALWTSEAQNVSGSASTVAGISSLRAEPQCGVGVTKAGAESNIRVEPLLGASIAKAGAEGRLRVEPQFGVGIAKAIAESSLRAERRAERQPSVGVGVAKAGAESSSRVEPPFVVGVATTGAERSLRVEPHCGAGVSKTGAESNSRVELQPSASVSRTGAECSSRVEPQPSACVAKSGAASTSRAEPQPSVGVPRIGAESSSRVQPQPSAGVPKIGADSSVRVEPPPSVTRSAAESSSRVEPQPSAGVPEVGAESSVRVEASCATSHAAPAPPASNGGRSQNDVDVPRADATNLAPATASAKENQRLRDELAEKTRLLRDVVQLHQSLEARFAALEEGLSWKDAQMEALAHQLDEASRGRAAWHDRAKELEEVNGVLRAALLERADENEWLRGQLEAASAPKQAPAADELNAKSQRSAQS